MILSCLSIGYLFFLTEKRLKNIWNGGEKQVKRFSFLTAFGQVGDGCQPQDELGSVLALTFIGQTIAIPAPVAS